MAAMCLPLCGLLSESWVQDSFAAFILAPFWVFGRTGFQVEGQMFPDFVWICVCEEHNWKLDLRFFEGRRSSWEPAENPTMTLTYVITGNIFTCDENGFRKSLSSVWQKMQKMSVSACLTWDCRAWSVSRPKQDLDELLEWMNCPEVIIQSE